MKESIIMINKTLFVSLFCLTQLAFANKVYIKEADLPKTEIPMPKGDPKVILAIAAKYGEAKGRITGEAARSITFKTGSKAPVLVYAKRKAALNDRPTCFTVQLTYTTTPEFQKQFKEQTLDVAVCPKKDEFMKGFQ